MNRYAFMSGFSKHAEALDFAAHLPPEAVAKVCPYSTGRHTRAFAVTVLRSFTVTTRRAFAASLPPTERAAGCRTGGGQ